MADNAAGDRQEFEADTIESTPSADHRDAIGAILTEAGRRQRWQVRTIDRTAVVHFTGPELFSEEAGVRSICDQLDGLIEQGYTRLLLNFGGVKCLPGDLLGRLAELQKKKLDLVRGRIQLCGLDSPSQDATRITHLDRLFDV
jgi:hypothetical protein